MNLYREKQQLLHFWNYPCGDIGGDYYSDMIQR